MCVGPDSISSSLVVYFTTLSVSQIIWNPMVGCLANSELERILKAAFVTLQIRYSDICPKKTTNDLRLTGIRMEHSLNTGPECDGYAILC
jgi:hypothetical protein